MYKHLRHALPLLLLLALTTARAQNSSASGNDAKERKITLYGNVYDSFTRAALKAHMTLMTADSAVVDTVTCAYWTWGTANSYYRFRVPRRQAKYIVKAEADGYDDCYVNFEVRYIARNKNFELPRHLMKKRSDDDDIIGEASLDGVVVRGTKVKIAYRGDTIVYNASAFNLPEGSMLDGLVRQMPGAELKSNGDIYINGKKIDYLTLNGNDFFKGDNKVMLDNLPYFTVQNVQVYHKQSERSEWKGRDVEKKDYVMDVRLKREYNRGTMVNTELGAGSSHRWLARLFALYYTDHTRLSVYGNMNNVNENRQPGQEGEWNPSNMPQGLRTTQQTGLNLTTEDHDKNAKENLSAVLEWSKTENQSRSSSERFSADGNILGGSASLSKSDAFYLNVNNRFTMKAPLQLWSSTQLSLNNGKSRSERQDSTLRDVIINETMNAGMSKYRRLNMWQNTEWFKKLPWGDEVEIGLFTTYFNNKPNQNFSQSRTRFVQTGQDDFRNRYNDTRSNGYEYNLQARYGINLTDKLTFLPEVNFNQAYRDSRNYNYRLDWLGNVSTTAGTPTLGWLPSNNLLMQAFDAANSDSHGNLTRDYRGELSLYYYNEERDESFDFYLPLHYQTEKMRFNDDQIDTIARRSTRFMNPSLNYYRWGKGGFKWLRYSMEVEQPDFASLMPADDTTNPLALTINNPGLKNRVTHQLAAHMNFRNDSTERNIYLALGADLVRNAWGMRTNYNTQTGVYTYMQDNVNGNWGARLSIGYERPLDKKKHLRGKVAAGSGLIHSVDFDIAYDDNAQKLSRVNTWTHEGDLSLNYQYDDLTVGLNSKAQWQHTSSSRENFQKINAWDYQYGLNATYTVPLVKLTVATDITMFSRRGYNMAEMNTDDLVWNALVSKSLLKEKLTLKLMAFDLLHQISSTQYAVNAQGRTETWNNCLPRYAMLTLSYKFQKMPKKK